MNIFIVRRIVFFCALLLCACGRNEQGAEVDDNAEGRFGALRGGSFIFARDAFEVFFLEVASDSEIIIRWSSGYRSCAVSEGIVRRWEIVENVGAGPLFDAEGDLSIHPNRVRFGVIFAVGQEVDGRFVYRYVDRHGIVEAAEALQGIFDECKVDMSLQVLVVPSQ